MKPAMLTRLARLSTVSDYGPQNPELHVLRMKVLAIVAHFSGGWNGQKESIADGVTRALGMTNREFKGAMTTNPSAVWRQIATIAERIVAKHAPESIDALYSTLPAALTARLNQKGPNHG